MNKRVKDYLEIDKKGIQPNFFPNEAFCYYSLPDFDLNGKPSIALGKEIESNKFLVEAGSILISKLNPRIKRVWLADHVDKKRRVSSTEFVVLRPKETADPTYFYYYLQQDNLYKQLESNAIGSTNSHVRFKPEFLTTIKVNIPKLRVQQKIAKILRTVDGQIEKTEAIIAKYKVIKQGLMQDLFTRGIDVATGKLRPPYQDAPELYKPSPLGMIPKEWDVQKLNELTNLIIDGTHFTPKYTERGVPFLRVTDIQQDEVDKKRIKFISEEEHQLLTKRCKPEIDDILLSKNGTIGITKVVDWDWEFSVFVSLCLIKPKHRLILSNFLSNQISSFVVFEQIRRRSKQGTVTNLHLEEIREFDILLPHNKLEQEKITERILLIVSTIRNEENNLKKLIQIKRGLMSDLLSGKIRVQVDEEVIFN
ncbi:restriction endonuclease subunit S [uncultured Pontibacter sp.]|uniref:restriction endonuclease subunit S n=1 Tax=uncultured Pontibacter sp. TaxID=453356 RepID=UPI00262ABAB6|nr:restriction endonuclease subunit S [uncultured Pontibacter sp.]